jgi:integrase
MFRLACNRTPPLMTYRPRIEKIQGIQNVRKGFFEAEEFSQVLTELAPDYREFVEFLYLTGCRKGEAAKIERRQVDWNGQVIKLEENQTKTGKPRTIPLAGPIEVVVRRAWQKASLKSPLLFQANAQAIHFGGASRFYAAWVEACTKAQLPGKLIHDLRRTGVRNLLRAGNDPLVVKAISGHRTMAVFERYDMRDERDLIAAALKLGDHLAAPKKKTAPKVAQIRGRGSNA